MGNLDLEADVFRFCWESEVPAMKQEVPHNTESDFMEATTGLM